ncbi:MAG: hypothetical protein JW850_09735 [Thermoflexales bacterium]|nr:hypothetical protein [Thermoflexales bacterium]
MAKDWIDRARRVRQSNSTWLCTARRAPTWIVPQDQPPYRPYLVLVLEQESERIRQARILEEQPGFEQVLEVLVEAMLPALPRRLLGFGGRTRPARILIDDAALAQALLPLLAQVEVRCEHRAVLPQVQVALREMEAHMSKRTPVPGLLSLPGVTQPLVGEFFAAAAEYYRRAPWQWMENWEPIEVHYPSNGRARYALVLGSGRETFGLSLYESLQDAREANLSTTAAQHIAWFSLVFEEATVASFEDLDAIEKYAWPVAGEQAYPLAFKATPPDNWGLPSAVELTWLAAAARVIPDFVVQHLRADRGLPRPAQATFALPGVHGGQTISLRYPAGSVAKPEAGRLAPGLGQDKRDDDYGAVHSDAVQELEEFIGDWYYDDKSHEFARQLGAFLFEFIDYLETTGLSRGTLRQHVRNCWSIGKLECDYGSRDTFSPTIFVGGPLYLYEFKRKMSDSKYAVNSYKSTWRKLGRYVRSMGYGSEAQEPQERDG